MLDKTTTPRAEFPARLRALMAERGLSQADLARKLAERLPGDHAPKVSRYLAGQTFPSPATLLVVAETLGVGVEDLLPGAVPPSPSVALRPVPGDPEMVLLQISRRVPLDKATEILRLIAS